MRIDIEDIRNGKYAGKTVYVCDFRQPDLDKKPIRKVAPTEVLVRANSDENTPKKEKIYYSDYHFVPFNKNGTLNSKVIKPFDNTGFRSYTGIPINVFSTSPEAISFFNEQCDDVINRFKDKKLTILKEIDDQIERIEKIKL